MVAFEFEEHRMDPGKQLLGAWFTKPSVTGPV